MIKDYEKIVKKYKCYENKCKNAILAFISGGLIGLFSEMLYVYFFNTLKLSETTSSSLVFVFWVTFASALTGLGVFDKLVEYTKAGLIVPSTGFAHANTSCAMDSNKEGLVPGIGASIFKLTGSIILYGIVFAIIFAFIKGVIL